MPAERAFVALLRRVRGQATEVHQGAVLAREGALEESGRGPSLVEGRRGGDVGWQRKVGEPPHEQGLAGVRHQRLALGEGDRARAQAGAERQECRRPEEVRKRCACHHRRRQALLAGRQECEGAEVVQPSCDAQPAARRRLGGLPRLRVGARHGPRAARGHPQVRRRRAEPGLGLEPHRQAGAQLARQVGREVEAICGGGVHHRVHREAAQSRGRAALAGRGPLRRDGGSGGGRGRGEGGRRGGCQGRGRRGQAVFRAGVLLPGCPRRLRLQDGPTRSRLLPGCQAGSAQGREVEGGAQEGGADGQGGREGRQEGRQKGCEKEE
mmetsp:Transcript_93681/g.270680  ORF Transcript_93681/g.270680 Transcript_93681/m.270680 type:complete len:324 (-) Transcript_93681:2454-3425(-)